MCGRYTLTRQERLIEEFEAALDPETPKNEWWKPRFNVAPTQPAPVVAIRDGARVVEMMRWGLIPFWGTKPGAKPPLMINARVESLGAKQIFRDALDRKRCLVPADGFFEWKRSGKLATPLYFHPSRHPEDHRYIAFAGLWARAKTDHGEVHSFTIITGKPNALVQPIHDRMPVVLARDAWVAWLDPANDGAAVRELLGVAPIGDWVVEQVSTHVNKATNDDPGCIEPVALLL
jgi:putative SOS response-associated peptidase YedK